MRVMRRYMCEESHAWSVRKLSTEEESPADQICPHGHPAIQASLAIPVDDVQILISPAAHIVDKVRGQRWPEDQYYFSLLNKEGVEIAMSRGHYGWDEVVKLAAFFKGKSVEQALMWWARRKL